MDKQPKKISIKINGQEKEYNEQQNEKQPQKNEMIPSSPQEEFSWVLPEDQPSKVVSIEDLRHVNNEKKTGLKKPLAFMKRTSTPNSAVKQVVFIMAVAILVGTGLGMFSLKMMTGEESVLVPKKPETVTVDHSPVLEEPAEEVTKPASLPNLSVYVVQAGVFSTKEAGEEAVRAMRVKGYAATVLPNNQTYALFIGIGLDESQTKEIGEHYKQKGENTYVKPYDISSIQIAGWSDEEQQVMVSAQKQFGALVSLSSAAAAGPSASLDGLNGIKDELIELKSKEKLDQNISKFLSYLLMAEASLDKYRKDQQEEAKWQAQQFLLEALNVYAQIG